jgi:hypothetical protein
MANDDAQIGRYQRHLSEQVKQRNENDDRWNNHGCHKQQESQSAQATSTARQAECRHRSNQHRDQCGGDTNTEQAQRCTHPEGRLQVGCKPFETEAGRRERQKVCSPALPTR